jgi:hypothetical protein
MVVSHSYNFITTVDTTDDVRCVSDARQYHTEMMPGDSGGTFTLTTILGCGLRRHWVEKLSLTIEYVQLA